MNDPDFREGYTKCIKDYIENGEDYCKNVTDHLEEIQFNEDGIITFFMASGYYLAYTDILSKEFKKEETKK